MLNIKHVLPTRRILRITELCSFKVTWILSFSDSVLMDDVCMTRFVFVFLAEGKKCPEESNAPVKQCNLENQVH